ncbi:flagellar filament capping protein FliD [Marinospirillum sp. MEB164]|uniref:Flagellar hook-associated protein 2 n=1 Tax=Marinospirillum alkalitolerans TaxID=3123374 RepID=A0ABW8PVZ5_9GAMM
MSGISFMGVGSGLPVNDIINATVAAEAQPLKRLENDKKFFQSQISALGQLTSRLSTMRTAMLDLRGQDKFSQLAAKPGNDKLFTATADHLAGATAGNYSIQVLAEARSYQQTSDPFSRTDFLAPEGAADAKLTFTGLKDADGNAIDPVEINVAGKTLDQVRQEINSNDGLKGKVSANLVNVDGENARLVLKAQKTGEEGRFSAEFSGVDLAAGLNAKVTNLSSPDFDFNQVAYDAITDLDEKRAYLQARTLDARISIDGIEASNSTNNFSNVVTGVSINITPGAMNEATKASSLEVKRDDKAIRDNIDQFVKAYNDVIIHLNEAKKGSLYGDNTIRTVEAEMRNILYSPTPSNLDSDTNSSDDIAADTQKNFLALIGIEVYTPGTFDPENPDSQNGTLRVNSAKLNEALENDFDRVAHILGASDFADGSGVDGYAARFADLAQRLTSTTTQNGQLSKGLLEVRREGLDNQVKRVDDRIESTNMRLKLLEDRLKRQFAAIEGLVANFNSSGSFLAQQMNNLPGYTRPQR